MGFAGGLKVRVFPVSEDGGQCAQAAPGLSHQAQAKPGTSLA
jgi:hypothetical protein